MKVNVLSNALEEADSLIDTLINFMAKALVESLAYTLADEEVDKLSETLLTRRKGNYSMLWVTRYRTLTHKH